MTKPGTQLWSHEQSETLMGWGLKGTCFVSVTEFGGSNPDSLGRSPDDRYDLSILDSGIPQTRWLCAVVYRKLNPKPNKEWGVVFHIGRGESYYRPTLDTALDLAMRRVSSFLMLTLRSQRIHEAANGEAP